MTGAHPVTVAPLVIIELSNSNRELSNSIKELSNTTYPIRELFNWIIELCN